MKINSLACILCFASFVDWSLHAVTYHSSRNEWWAIKSPDLDFIAPFIVYLVYFQSLFFTPKCKQIPDYPRIHAKAAWAQSLYRTPKTFPPPHRQQTTLRGSFQELERFSLASAATRPTALTPKEGTHSLHHTHSFLVRPWLSRPPACPVTSPPLLAPSAAVSQSSTCAVFSPCL